MIYFNNSAIAPIFPQSLNVYIRTSQWIIGDPPSLHDLGNRANRLLQRARKQTINLIHVRPEKVYSTSGGTEGDNWILKGTIIEKREYGNHMIVSGVEHPTVSGTAEQLRELEVEVGIAPVDKRGFIHVDELKELIRKETVLVSVMAVNSEAESARPTQEISGLLDDFPKIHLYVDAVQAARKVSFSQWLTEGVDFTTFSTHRFHGPRRTGFTYWKKGRRLTSLLAGGE